MNTKQHHEPSPLYRLEHAAHYLQVSKTFLIAETNAGRLPAFKPSPKVTLYRRADLDAYVLTKQANTKKRKSKR